MKYPTFMKGLYPSETSHSLVPKETQFKMATIHSRIQLITQRMAVVLRNLFVLNVIINSFSVYKGYPQLLDELYFSTIVKHLALHVSENIYIQI